MSKLQEFLVVDVNQCRNCQFRREKYQKAPQECLECGFLADRERPYQNRVPVFREGYIAHDIPEFCQELINVVKDDIPVDRKGNITEMFFNWPVGTPRKEIVQFFKDRIEEYRETT